MSNNITYSYSIGGSEFVDKAYYLTESLRRNVTEPHIVTYLLERETDEIGADYLAYFNRTTELVVGSRPIKDYPISAKLAAANAAAELSSRDLIVQVDTDTVVLNEFHDDTFDSDAAAYLKPVDIGNQYWGLERSESDWAALYDRIGHAVPSRRILSSVDKLNIFPYYNAGTLVIRDFQFARDWLETTRLVRDESTTRYADQIALGLLASQYEVDRLNERSSWILPLRLRCPKDVNVLRYQDFYHLIRVLNPTVRDNLRKIGILDEVDATDKSTYLNAALQLYKTFRLRTLRTRIDRTHVR